MRVEQVGGAVQRDGRLAGPGAAGDHEDARQGGPDRLVLLGLDRGDDVAHPAGAVPARARRAAHPRPIDREPAGCGGVGVEDLVVEPDEHPPRRRG